MSVDLINQAPKASCPQLGSSFYALQQDLTLCETNRAQRYGYGLPTKGRRVCVLTLPQLMKLGNLEVDEGFLTRGVCVHVVMLKF
jgi:hypothetical protein